MLKWLSDQNVYIISIFYSIIPAVTQLESTWSALDWRINGSGVLRGMLGGVSTNTSLSQLLQISSYEVTFAFAPPASSQLLPG